MTSAFSPSARHAAEAPQMPAARHAALGRPTASALLDELSQGLVRAVRSIGDHRHELLVLAATLLFVLVFGLLGAAILFA